MSDVVWRVGVPHNRLPDLGLYEINGEHLEDGGTDGQRGELADDLAPVRRGQWRRNGA
jgi:hypothetical protein